ncbi:hypothetical protein EMIT047CA2_150106 [Pseudomonas soli]
MNSKLTNNTHSNTVATKTPNFPSSDFGKNFAKKMMSINRPNTVPPRIPILSNLSSTLLESNLCINTLTG